MGASFADITKQAVGPSLDPNQVSPAPSQGGKMASTNSASSGQAQMGQPNQNSQYTNTISPWDNGQAPTMANNPTSGGAGNPVHGKGKGG